MPSLAVYEDATSSLLGCYLQAPPKPPHVVLPLSPRPILVNLPYSLPWYLDESLSPPPAPLRLIFSFGPLHMARALNSFRALVRGPFL